MSEHEKSTRKKSMGAEKFHAFMKNKLAVGRSRTPDCYDIAVRTIAGDRTIWL